MLVRNTGTALNGSESRTTFTDVVHEDSHEDMKILQEDKDF